MQRRTRGWHMTEASRRGVQLAALLALATCLSAPLAAQSTALAKRLDARLDAPPFNRQLWGVALVDDNGKLLYGRNHDRMFIPASNTKIVVRGPDPRGYHAATQIPQRRQSARPVGLFGGFFR